MQNIERAGNNLLVVTAYGDAAGLPVETWTAQQIADKYGRLDHLVDPKDNLYFKGETSAGMWSDDTQLSLAVAEGLMAADGFDLDTQAEFFAAAYHESVFVEHKGKRAPRGWGGSTVNSALRLINGTSPEKSGERGGVGNGVLMKLGPLVLWQVARATPLNDCYKQYDALTTMTHDDNMARWATRIHGDLLRHVLQHPDTQPGIMAYIVNDAAVRHERRLDIGNEGSTLLDYLQHTDLVGKPERILDHTDGKGFYAPQTLAMAYGVLLASQDDFTNTVYAAVNLGGDTDSIASIVANTFNFNSKGDLLLPEDSKKLHDIERLSRVSAAFTMQALKGAK